MNLLPTKRTGETAMRASFATGKKTATRAVPRKAAGKSRRTSAGRPLAAKSKSLKLALPAAAKPAQMPRTLRPQLATLVTKVPSGDNWVHELKFDGYRILAWLRDGRVTLRTRAGNHWTDRFPTVARAVASLPVATAILDGEIVALDERGVCDFERLQNFMRRGVEQSLVYYVFDLPYLDGHDLSKVPLVERKEALAKILRAVRPRRGGTVRLSEHIVGHGEQVLDFARRLGMEGIVSKRADGSYVQGRTKTWLKIKCLQRQEFVIGGYTNPSGARTDFGSLLVGYYESGRFVYCGHVGTGFTRQSLREIRQRLKPLRTDRPPFENPPRGTLRRQATWVKPQLVAEVEFGQWTKDGVLRHPSFKGLRDDKDPREIGRERSADKP